VLLAVLLVTLPASVSLGKDNSEVGNQMKFGISMAKRGLWSEALFRFRRAEQADPVNPRVLNNIAVASEAVGQFEEALAYYQKALKLDPTERDLKRNYARFVEFYQAFKPKEEIEAEEEAEEMSESVTEPAVAEPPG